MNIDKIEVSENNISFVIYPKKNVVIINNKEYNIETKTIEDLIKIISIWDHEYYDSSYMDGNTFEVVVYSNEKDIFRGIRGVPRNYDSFSKLVWSIYDRR